MMHITYWCPDCPEPCNCYRPHGRRKIILHPPQLALPEHATACPPGILARPHRVGTWVNIVPLATPWVVTPAFRVDPL